MKLKNIIVYISVAILAFLALSESYTVKADAPYKTYTLDGYGSVIETQTAYLPYKTITKIGELTFKNPKDFTILSDGTMYVLDSGNKRVVVADTEGNYISSFGEEVLNSPRGMFVTEDRTCYVADRDARKVLVFDKNGQLINSYGKPSEPLYGDNQDFLPLKVVANDSGTIYVICESNTNGIVQISPVNNGTFLGYFGTNSTNASIWNIIWRAILTDAQRAKMQGNIPATPDNMAIDDKGLIYTVTRGEHKETLKWLNIAGINMINPDSNDEIPAAVAVGNHDNVFVASQMGYIYEYNNEGELLFVFGGSDDGDMRIGLSTKVEAIQVDSRDRIYLLDADKAQIQVFEPTEFTNYLHDALFLFSKGRYTESKEPLAQVLKMNNLFDYANMAMGKALYKEGDYAGALKYAKLAKDTKGYSNAYWEIRNNWLKKNLATVFIVLIAVFALIKGISVLDKKKGILAAPKKAMAGLFDKKLIKEIQYMFFFMRHPVDGAYGIKFQKKVSLLSANIILVVGVLFYIINKYFCGFFVKTVREGEYEVASDIGLILIALILIVSCNYLICTINDGEGKFRHIYSSFIYAFAPYLVFTPVIFILSHVVTENEIFFVEIARIVMYVWIAVLVFMAVKEINNYKIGETVKIILLTVFTIVIACLLGFIIYVLWSQVFDFIQSVVGEVVYKIGNK